MAGPRTDAAADTAASIAASAAASNAAPVAAFKSNTTREEFHAMVARAKEYITAGDIFQVVLSQRFEADVTADPFTVYRALRHVNPSPYMYFMRMGGLAIVGSSPDPQFGPVLFYVGLAIFAAVGLVIAGAIMGAVV
mgnify:CR=1 FL=1